MRRILLAVAALFGAAVSASAATVPYRTDAELVAISDRVVRGRVLDSVVERAPSGIIRTRTRVAVIEDFTGGAETMLTVLERGGRLPDGTTVWIPGAPRFAPGDEVVLCLKRTADGYRTVSMGFSAFRVGTAVAGDRPLTRFGGTAVVGGGGVAGVEASRGLAGFKRTASAVRGMAARTLMTEGQATAAVAAATRARVDEPFTLLGEGLRWQQVDSGQAITWYRNTFRPSPIQGADTDDQIRAAVAAWTDPPASITLAFGGTRDVAIQDVPGEDPYCNAGNLGVGLITFGDPLDELEDGVLAIGGGCASSSTHVVNGTIFNPFTHGLVVLNDDASLEGYRTAPNITRIIEHEVGHGIGLGHTDAGQDNIMYPACCLPGMPVPPAIGPDDLAGLVFIYPPCSFTLSTTSISMPAVGGVAEVLVTASIPTCGWRPASTVPWLEPIGLEQRVGSGPLRFLVAPQLESLLPRTGTVILESASVSVSQAADVDADQNNLYDGWTAFFGLDTLPAADGGPNGDPDGDGQTNRMEHDLGTHPRGAMRRYFAEGVSNAFFDTELALFVPGSQPGRAVVRIQQQNAIERIVYVSLPPRTRRTVSGALLRSLTDAPFAMVVESDVPVVADRTVRWDATGYGAHAESAILAPATEWYLAEGSTAGDFVLFYLLQNPGDQATIVNVRFLRPWPLGPVFRSYTIAARSRLTIPVNSLGPELASTDVSGVVTSTLPIVVERAMYRDAGGQTFAAGHGSAGVTAPATEWFLAEGATGSFFDLFALIANPSSSEFAEVRVQYLLPSGGTITKDYTVAPNSRFTIYVDDEQIPAGSGQRPLASTAVAMRFTSINGLPIIVERAMWWPQPVWYEAHNAVGATATGTVWAVAGGRTGGSVNAETYLLIANTSGVPGTARVTICAEDAGQAPTTLVVPLPANSRTNVAVSDRFPSLRGLRFSAIIESIGDAPVPIVVERSMYESPAGVTWAAGTAILATRLTP
jgi:hypothetical protein